MDQEQIVRDEEHLRKTREHIIESIDFFIVAILMVLLILTMLFKPKRLKFIHESSLAIFYGCVFGAVLRFGFPDFDYKTITVTAQNYTLKSIYDLPESIHLYLSNLTEGFIYSYKEPLINRNSDLHEFEEKVTFDPEIFFNLLLPPIIFQSGYSMKRV